MAKKQKTDMVTCTMKCNIIKPLNVSWKELGTRLHEIRHATHVALNDCVATLELESRSGSKTHPQTRSYQVVAESMKHTNVYSHIALPVAGLAFKEWSVFNKTEKKGICQSFPTFKRSGSVLVGPTRWSLEGDGEEFNLRITLSKNEPEYIIRVGICGARFVSEARSIASGAFKRGELRIMWSETERKWSARIVYSKAQVEKREGSGVIAVHRGVKAFLFCAAPDGDCGPLFFGDDVVEFKKRMAIRKASLQRHMKAEEIGSGAKGHGQSRRFQAIIKIRDAEARYVRTKCQQAAAAVVKKAVEKGASTILIEDYGTVNDNAAGSWMVKRWPWFELKQCIKWACKKAGVKMKEATTSGLTSTCPKCGACKEGVSVKDGQMLCRECGLDWRTDAVACWNMLKRNGFDTGYEIAKRNHKAKTSRFKESAV